ncbi:MAG: pilus assembly protein TadG-related protein [Emcibacteraceae bacterium]
MFTYFSKFIKIGRELRRNQKGAILFQVALSATVFIGILGIGVDLGRAYLYRSQLSGALDAAALAGAKSFHSATRDAEIQAFFDSNFDSSLMGGQVQTLNIREVDTATKTLEVSTSGTVNTVFMRLFGFDTVSIAADAETTSKQTGLQLVMVLDNTGSMRQYASGTKKIDALKTSAKAMVNNLFGNDATNDKLEIAIVPYVTTVNIGHLLDSSYIDTSTMPASYTYDANNLSKWNGCVEARHTNSDLSAADAYDVKVEHEGVDWVPFLWRPHYDNVYSLSDLNGPNGEVWPAPDYQHEGGSGENVNADGGPNINCPAPVLDFTSTKADLNTYIDSLYYSYNRGGTIANIGMIWGWRMLHTGSPFFNDIAYDDDKMVKAVVLMTDGENWVIDRSSTNPYYDKQDRNSDNDDAWDDDGDGKCPQCVNAQYDGGDETFGYDRRYSGDYSGYGVRDEGRLDGATTQSSSSSAINKRLAYVCSAMKGMGITVYTITFGSGATNTTLKNLYEGCATDSGKYFHAPDAAELDGAFEAIANDLADLRLSK